MSFCKCCHLLSFTMEPALWSDLMLLCMRNGWISNFSCSCYLLFFAGFLHVKCCCSGFEKVISESYQRGSSESCKFLITHIYCMWKWALSKELTFCFVLSLLLWRALTIVGPLLLVPDWMPSRRIWTFQSFLLPPSVHSLRQWIFADCDVNTRQTSGNSSLNTWNLRLSNPFHAYDN